MGSITRSFANNITTAGKFDGTKLTGDIPEANLSANAPAFDDNKIVNDLSTLGLRVHTQENLNASNTNSQYVDVFNDDSGYTNGANTSRSTDEYISTIQTYASSYVTSDRTSQFNVASGTLTSAVSWYDNSESENRLFNGDNSTGNTSNSTYLSEGSTYTLSNVNLLTIDYGANSANHKAINAYKFYGNGSNQGGASNPSGKIQGSNNNSDWTDLQTITNNFFQISGNGTQEITWTNNTGYRYYRWLGTSGVMSNSGWWYEIELKEATPTTANATGNFLCPAITAGSATTKMGAVITYQDNAGTNALNTDIVLQLSADNGSNFSTATLTALPDFSSGIKMAKVNDLAVTSGTQLKYKISFANQAVGSKEARIRGVSLNY
jgi:hypothetical protein